MNLFKSIKLFMYCIIWIFTIILNNNVANKKLQFKLVSSN